jgi:CubicO group peptidase (beta-lactamase class C family)
LPLLFDPGTSWNYSVGLDVVGRVVEVVSGMQLGQFFRREIFEPLDMTDSDFYLPPSKRGDLARIYEVDARTGLTANETLGVNVFDRTAGHFGGGGMVSTLRDYARFACMLAGKGATANGERLLDPRSADLMLSNHLPGRTDIASFGRLMASELGFVGLGQAYGGTVRIAPASGPDAASRPVGDYGWGGIAGTYFWVNPARRHGAVFMLQAFPPAALPIRGELHRLVNAALSGSPA